AAVAAHAQGRTQVHPGSQSDTSSKDIIYLQSKKLIGYHSCYRNENNRGRCYRAPETATPMRGTLFFCIASLSAGTSFASTSRHIASWASSCRSSSAKTVCSAAVGAESALSTTAFR